MTDSNATELHKLCEILDEHGIEWTKGDVSYQVVWTNPNGQHCSAMWWKPTLTVLISGCTPEQAVAATLGAVDNPPLDKLLRCLENDYDGLRKVWLTESTEALERGECEMELTDTSYHGFDVYRCSSCGTEVAELTYMGKSDKPNFCPNCGKAVKR